MKLRRFSLTICAGCVYMLRTVMVEMATVAEGCKISKTIVILIMVKVGNRECYLIACHGMGLIVGSPTPFTKIVCTANPD
ncbi:MAG: hypothetical protein A2W17_06260 [Planctomycetes bacterium RBG_16_41_13]|nr:MAG: hypothetical protein A2W17_06260 [Planctomycetes bacterium RBG_16_41_13]